MTDRKKTFGPPKPSRSCVRVGVGNVINVVAVLFHPEREREFPKKPFAGAGRQGAVEDLAVLAVGPVEAHIDIWPAVPVLLPVVVESELIRPPIIGLPGRVR